MISLQGRPLEMACPAWSSEANVELGQGGEAQKMHKKWVCADVTLFLFMRLSSSSSQNFLKTAKLQLDALCSWPLWTVSRSVLLNIVANKFISSDAKL